MKIILNINGIDPEEPPAGITYGLPTGDLRGFVHAAMRMNVVHDRNDFVHGRPARRGRAVETMYRILQVRERGLDQYIEERE